MPYTGRHDGCDELLFPLDRVGVLIEIALTTVAGMVGLLIFIYYLRKGQFEDIEDVKYEIFRNDDEKPQ